MKIINTFQYIELKKMIKDQFNIDIHIHDTCGGQYFVLEQTNEFIIDYIKNLFLERHISVRFNKEQTEFILEEMKQC